ncbi:MAG: hypothetical protein K5762_07560 [Bacilli bacterium]|jgi:hypothetical protein|nr:hypothetical protein [Bacilli bacterium]
MHKNIGRLKEDEFVRALNGKKICDLPHNLQHMMKEIYGFFDPEEVVIAGLVDKFQKPDFFIEYKGDRKYISLKSGRATTVGEEDLKKFVLYLREKGLSIHSQATILLNHFSDGTMDGSGKERIDYVKFKAMISDRIKELNEELNCNKDFVIDFVVRHVFIGTVEGNQPADYICFGDVNYCVVCSKEQVIKHLHRRDWKFMDNPHIGPLQFKAHARYVGKEIRYEYKRWKTDIWWANLGPDMQYIAERYDG